jgi:hypothetical protein
MPIFTSLAKFYSTKLFCNTKTTAGIFVQKKNSMHTAINFSTVYHTISVIILHDIVVINMSVRLLEAVLFAL